MVPCCYNNVNLISILFDGKKNTCLFSSLLNKKLKRKKHYLKNIAILERHMKVLWSFKYKIEKKAWYPPYQCFCKQIVATLISKEILRYFLGLIFWVLYRNILTTFLRLKPLHYNNLSLWFSLIVLVDTYIFFYYFKDIHSRIQW